MDKRALRPQSASSARRTSTSSAGSAALGGGQASQQDAEESVAMREAKIRQWMQRKEILDKGLELFSRLDSRRAESEESLRRVAMTAYAIDALSGVLSDKKKDLEQPSDSIAEPKTTEEKQKPVQKTLKSAWLKWARDNHTFSNIKFTASEASAFSATLREFLEPEGDHFILLSLKYSFPARPKPNEKPKPLTSDQQLQNATFNKQCMRVWKEARAEVEKNINRDTTESKSGNDAKDSSSRNAQGSNQPNTLFAHGLPCLRLWIEEDDDVAQARAKEAASERATEKKVAYEGFVKKKDSLRIKLPPPEVVEEMTKRGKLRPQSAPRMHFGRELQVVRPKNVGAPMTTAELMAASGLKYVHATKRGLGQGVAGDLELSRKKLLDIGYVDKANIEVDPDSGNSLRFVYEQTLEENGTLKELKRNFEKTQNESGKAFEQWAALKASRDQALKFLSHLDAPVVTGEDPDAKSGTRAVVYCSPLVDRCIEVGKALKRVDRTLLTEWSRWCAGVIPAANATILWDSFFPIACDVHGVLGSMVREAFLKLLKPGFNYQETFRFYAEKKVRRNEAHGSTQYSDDERNKRIAETKLSRKEMTQLLLDMGLSLKPNEIGALIEAFDANCDGSVSMQEFLDYIGPMRTTNAGALAALNQKCCWRTTCKKTGMCNAYTICELSSKKGSSNENEGDNNNGSRFLIANTETITLATGEKRLRMELLERQRHEDLLRKYGILSSESVGRKSRSSRRAESKSQSPTRDNYDADEFEKEDDYADDFDKNEDVNSTGNQKCGVVTLTMDDRKKGLKFLDEITKETRQEKALKALLSTGQPPAAPKLWVVQSRDTDAEDEDIDFSTEFWVKWEPKLNDLVSFFSLEFGGPVGSMETKYREVYRDPPDANPDSLFKFNYRLTDLQPGTSYLLRIRGINGYGPGDFTYKTFATYPAPPLKPRVERITPTSATLRWLFSKVYTKRMADLRNLFDSIDEDRSGTVSRKELADAMNEKASCSQELRSFLNKMRGKFNIPENAGFLALFDSIEGDDDELISWEEFENFFLSAGWCDSPDGRTAAQDLGGSGNEVRAKTADDDVRGSRNGALSSSQSNASRVTYVVEKCISEFDDAYKEVLRTTLGECTINHLEPGQSYRFRVYAINSDGGKGECSDSVIVHAILDTPSAPALATRWSGPVVQANSVVLQWRSRRHGITSRNPLVVKKMIGDWTGAGEDEGGVSVEAAFAKYDTNGDGTMDIAEFRNLLEDLGIECTKERLGYAFSLFDTNKDGILSFAEFSAFWRRDEVTYTLKRSEPIRPTSSSAMSGSVTSVPANGSKASNNAAQTSARPESRGGSRRPSSASANQATAARPSTAAAVKKQAKDIPTPVTSYRAGPDLMFEERGLIPNSLYYFKLRYVGSKVNSALSVPFAIMTAPLPPSAPVVIRVTNSSVKLKWYAPQYGAYKFELQLSTVSSASGLTSASGEWSTVYSGQETFFMSTTLSSETLYSARVVALNYQGAPSVASPAITFKTPSRSDSKDDLLPKNVSSVFSVECVSDICVGDIILISERLFAKQRAGGDDFGGRGGVDAPPSTTVKKSGVVRMDMSVTSVTGTQPPPGSYIGERTIAAHVVRDNYKSFRDSTGSNKIDVIKFINSRRLWLEVIWEKSSTEACKAYKLSPGTVIERTQSHFEQFEVFRTAWMHERSRLPFATEIQALEDCFTSPDM